MEPEKPRSDQECTAVPEVASGKPKRMSPVKFGLIVAGASVWVVIVAAATISNNRSGAWDKMFSSKPALAEAKSEPPSTPQIPAVEEVPEKPSSATLVDFQLSSKMKLEELLRDPHSAEYSNVRAHLISKAGEQPNYSFCGTVNAKNGFGGYSGSQRFVANPLIAIVEDGTPDFDQVWAMSCSTSSDQGEIWF